MSRFLTAAIAALTIGNLSTSSPAAVTYGQRIGNDLGRCSGDGPAVRVTVSGIRSSSGTIRVQAYRGIAADWLVKGRWLTRIEAPAHRGSMTFCLPVSAAGTYAVAVRHDANGNGDTDIRSDGGGMSNNPSINIFNLGKPSYTRVGVAVSGGVKPIRIQMKYM